MTTTECTDARPALAPRILSAWSLRRGSDLSSHLAVHGPNPVPSRPDERLAESVLEEVRRSGLGGRGGAGFPAARKWDTLRRSRRPLLVVNAMEGEPASEKDQVLLSKAPHLVLDGAQLAALAVGAGGVVVCVADHRPACAAAVERAVEERVRAGADNVEFRVLRPPGRYVTGEESALANWLAGGGARPTFRLRKAEPLSVGHRPVLVQNAETLANVALIARHGSDWFREVGLDDAPGTILVTVSGAFERRGVHEVALGTPIESILTDAVPLSPSSAVLVGGYGGTWLHRDLLGTPYAPRQLSEVGCAMGVGILAAVPVESCGVAETARVARYMAGESAGQCGPCVFGLPAVANDLELLAQGRADRSALARLRRRLDMVEGRGACRHPDGVVRMVRSALEVFSDDVADHARHRPCQGWSRRPVLPVPRAPDEAVRTRAAVTGRASTLIGAWRS